MEILCAFPTAPSLLDPLFILTLRLFGSHLRWGKAGPRRPGQWLMQAALLPGDTSVGLVLIRKRKALCFNTFLKMLLQPFAAGRGKRRSQPLMSARSQEKTPKLSAA